jgi:hypothetical protein
VTKRPPTSNPFTMVWMNRLIVVHRHPRADVNRRVCQVS